MNISDFYATVGGNYEEVSARLVSEKLILKYVKRFVDDTGFQELLTAFENDDAHNAFRAAHTLKGNCSTLGFGKLYETAFELTELLRNQDFIDRDKAIPLLNDLKDSYYLTVTSINSLDL